MELCERSLDEMDVFQMWLVLVSKFRVQNSRNGFDNYVSEC